jgi:type II secretory pathway pseudopilin PulG
MSQQLAHSERKRKIYKISAAKDSMVAAAESKASEEASASASASDEAVAIAIAALATSLAQSKTTQIQAQIQDTLAAELSALQEEVKTDEDSDDSDEDSIVAPAEVPSAEGKRGPPQALTQYTRVKGAYFCPKAFPVDGPPGSAHKLEDRVTHFWGDAQTYFTDSSDGTHPDEKK